MLSSTIFGGPTLPRVQLTNERLHGVFWRHNLGYFDLAVIFTPGTEPHLKVLPIRGLPDAIADGWVIVKAPRLPLDAGVVERAPLERGGELRQSPEIDANFDEKDHQSTSGGELVLIWMCFRGRYFTFDRERIVKSFRSSRVSVREGPAQKAIGTTALRS